MAAPPSGGLFGSLGAGMHSSPMRSVQHTPNAISTGRSTATKSPSRKRPGEPLDGHQGFVTSGARKVPARAINDPSVQVIQTQAERAAQQAAIVGGARGKVEEHHQIDVLYPRLNELLTSETSGHSEDDYVKAEVLPAAQDAFGAPQYAQQHQQPHHELHAAKLATITAPDRLRRCAALPLDIAAQAERCTVYTARGLFPEINRAWMTIDSSIYLWDFEDGTDFCVYEELDEVIVSVALVKPKPGVYREQIEYLLILATPLMVYLVGVEFSGDQTGPRRHGMEINLDPDALHTAPTDNVNMNCITGTADGRIFMGGRDGCLYELVYQKADGWLFSRKCRKINHTSGVLSFLVPPIFKPLVGASDEAILQLLWDSSRGVLYSRTKSSVQVYHLSADNGLSHGCLIQPKKGRLYLPDLHGSIVSIAVIPKEDCVSLPLVAVTSKGARVFFGASGYTLGYDPLRGHDTMGVVHVRVLKNSLTPPFNVHAAHYHQGRLTIASTRPDGGDDLWCVTPQVFHNARPYSAVDVRAPRKDNPVFKLEEVVTRNRLEGKVDCILEIPRTVNSSVTHNPLASQHLSSLQSILLSTKGTVVLKHMQPVDHLRALLSQGNDTDLAEFFRARAANIGGLPQHLPGQQEGFGVEQQQREAERREACAACLIVACSADGLLLDSATRAFQRYGGEPSITSNQQEVASNSIFGRAAVGPCVMYSGKHDGICLYISRLLEPIWNKSLTSHPKDGSNAGMDGPAHPSDILSRMTKEELLSIADQLSQLLRFIEQCGLATSMAAGDVVRNQWDRTHLKRMMAIAKPRTAVAAAHAAAEAMPPIPGNAQMDPVQMAQYKYKHYLLMHPGQATALEKESFQGLHLLITKSIESLQLWVVLMNTDFSAVAADLDERERQRLKQQTFAEFALSEDGEGLAKTMVSRLLKRFLNSPDHTELSNRLHKLCPNLHNRLDVISAKAEEALSVASVSKTPQAMQSALDLYRQLYESGYSYETLPSICSTFANLGYYDGIVKLALECASAPLLSSALAHYRTGQPVEDRQGREALTSRKLAYKCITDILPSLPEASAPGHAGKSTKESILKQVLLSDDELAHIAVFEWYLSIPGGAAQLIRLKSKYLEDFLRNYVEQLRFAGDKNGHREALHLLSLFHRQNERYFKAAELLAQLAEGDWGETITLEQRLQYLSEAITCAKIDTVHIAGAGEFLHTLEAKLEVAQLQREILDTLEYRFERLPANASDRHGFSKRDYQIARQSINRELKNITDLHDEYTSHFSLSICTLSLVHCASVDINLEELWSDVLDELIADNQSAEVPPSSIVQRVLDTVVQLAHKYRSKNAFVPLRAIMEKLELLTVQVAPHGNSTIVLKALKSAGFSFHDLYTAYAQIHAKQIPDWRTHGQPFHIYRVIYELLTLWRSQVQRGTLEWHQLRSVAQDTVPSYLTELDAQQGPDPQDLVLKFRQFQRTADLTLSA